MARSLPALSTLVLTQNQVAELGDLEALKGMGRLVHLSLLGNPVQNKEVCVCLCEDMDGGMADRWQNYRYYVLYLAPSIRFLDFQKVKDAERTKARELFGTHDAPTELARNIVASRANGSLGGVAPLMNGTAKTNKHNWSPAEKMRYQMLIQNAKSLSEVARLEKEVAEGRIPPGVADSEAMDET